MFTLFRLICLVLPIGAGSSSAVDSVRPVAAPAQGHLLVAKRHLRDPTFVRSVLLLLRHSPGGSLGVIINRPGTLSIAAALPAFAQLQGSDQPLYFGGPVASELIAFLTRHPRNPGKSMAIGPQLFFGHEDATLAILLDQGKSPQSLRVFAGYAGWAPGQLAGEIKRGDWFVIEAPTSLLFADTVTTLWSSLIDRLDQPSDLAIDSADGATPQLAP